MAAATLSANQGKGRMPQGPRLAITFAPVTGLCLALAGCAQHSAEGTAEAPPEVTVSYPVEREVTDYADYTARTAAVDSVELRARVSGYLDKVNFKEGVLVKKGDLLFEIDPRTYKAVLKNAESNLAAAEARVKRLTADVARAAKLISTQTIAQEEYDRYVGDHGEAVASQAALKAAVERAQLDLGFTKVTAPVSGRISRYFVTVGNLIQAGDLTGGTLLTTIVSVDPMYAYFDVDEHTVLRVKQLIREGKAKTPDDPDIPVWLGLANEAGHPHQGFIDFVDNQVNPRTGTLRVRGVFPNKDETLSPGLFARVRVPIGFPHKTLLVTELRAGYGPGAEDRLRRGQGQPGGFPPRSAWGAPRWPGEIADGLKAGERVIVNGLQQVRPGLTVEPKLVDMPTKRG